MQKKLKIDTATAIVDIIAAVIAILAPILIIGSVFNDTIIQYGTTTIIGGQTDTLVNVLTIIMVIVLVLHIVALVKSKKAGISLTGSILGIIGSALFAFIGAIMGIVSMVLFILASIFLFKQKRVA